VIIHVILHVITLRISCARQTLPEQNSVAATGRNPRAVWVGVCHDGGGSLPLERTVDGFLPPSKERVLAVVMQVLFFNQEN
jgi:hypothetical protein